MKMTIRTSLKAVCSLLVTASLLILHLLQIGTLQVEAYHCASDDLLQSNPSEVIPVPPTSPSNQGGGQWLSLQRFVNQTGGRYNLVLRSTNQSCFVEAMFWQYAAPRTTQLIVYPNGRSSPYSLNFERVVPFCFIPPYGDIMLGLSVISIQRELGFVWAALEDVTKPVLAKFEFWYRQRCSGDHLEGLNIVQLQSPTSNGNWLSFSYQTSATEVSWDESFKTVMIAIPRSLFLNCSLDARFNFIQNGFEPTVFTSDPLFNQEAGQALVGPEFIVPVNTSLYVRHSGYGVLKIDMIYRLVCGGMANNGTRLSLPLPDPIVVSSLTEWTTVEFDRTNVSAYSRFVWAFQPRDPNTTQIIIEQGVLNSTADVDIHVSYNTLSSTQAIQTIDVASFKERFRYTFRYRLISTVSTEPPINVTSESWRNFTISADVYAYKSKWRLRSTRPECRVEVGRAMLPKGHEMLWPTATGFGFNPNLSIAAEDVPQGSGRAFPLTSFGQEIGIGFDLTRGLIVPPHLNGDIQWPYRMVCGGVKLPPPVNGMWASVELKFPTPGSYTLTVPSVSGCSIDMFSYVYASEVNEHVRVVCGDEWALISKPLEIQTRSLGTCKVLQLTPLSPGSSPLAYRLRCPGGPILETEELPRIDMGEVVLLDSNQWRTIAGSTGDDNPDQIGRYHPIVRTFRTKRPGCVVELHVHYVDFAHDIITENILEMNLTLGKPVDRGFGLGQWDSFTYTSCTNILYYVQPFVDRQRRILARQICSPSVPSDSCGQVQRRVQARFEWQETKMTAYNSNQLQKTSIWIAFPANSPPELAIELYFTSLVEQDWLGYDAGQYHTSQFTDFGRVMTNGLPAFIGKSRLFRKNVTITTNIIAERGDHIFTAKYRLRNLTEGRTPSKGVDVLVATNETQTIKFNIPPQFSDASRQAILARTKMTVDAYSESSFGGGNYYRWKYRHEWAIRPATSGCRVLARVTKLDIGTGEGISRATFAMFQQRLAIGAMKSDPLIPAFEMGVCAIQYDHFFPKAKARWTVPIGNLSRPLLCARVGPYYLTNPHPENNLIVRFESVPDSHQGEYEYEELYSLERKETWGSGWELEYSQVCDEVKAMHILDLPLIPLLATERWQYLPPLRPGAVTPKWFMDMRYRITPTKPKCHVQVHWQARYRRDKRILQLFDAQNNLVHLSESSEYEQEPGVMVSVESHSANFSVVLLSTPPSKRAGKFLFRQVCAAIKPRLSQSPTTWPLSPALSRSPTFTTPTHSPTSLVKDGWTCFQNDQCQSGMCSMTLMSCLAQTCASQCRANSNSLACDAFAQIGCACNWNVTSRQCLTLP